MTKKTYSSQGYVWGKCWGGGECGFAAEKLKGYSTRKELVSEIKKQLKSGRLDSGMGYERLLGAVLWITCDEELEQDGKTWTRSEGEEYVVGEMSEEAINLLSNQLIFN